MARHYFFYSFSAATWRAQLGSADAATLEYLFRTFDEHAADPQRANDAPFYEEARKIASRLVNQGALEVGPGDEEPPLVTWMAELLLTHNQTRLVAPAFDDFTYALSQVCVAPDPSVDDIPLAATTDEKAVAELLRVGRGVEGTPNRYSIYCALSERSEVDALAMLCRSACWQEYAGAHRYNPAAAPAFHKQRSQFAEWVDACDAGGRDILFTSSELRGVRQE